MQAFLANLQHALRWQSLMIIEFILTEGRFLPAYPPTSLDDDQKIAFEIYLSTEGDILDMPVRPHTEISHNFALLANQKPTGCD